MTSNVNNNSLPTQPPIDSDALSRIYGPENEEESKLPMIVRGFLQYPNSELCRADFLEHLSTLSATFDFIQLAQDIIGEKDMLASDFYMFLLKARLFGSDAIRFENAVKDLATMQTTTSKVNNLQEQIFMKDAQLGAYGREMRQMQQKEERLQIENAQIKEEVSRNERRAVEERQGRLADRELFVQTTSQMGQGLIAERQGRLADRELFVQTNSQISAELGQMGAELGQTRRDNAQLKAQLRILSKERFERVRKEAEQQADAEFAKLDATVNSRENKMFAKYFASMTGALAMPLAGAAAGPAGLVTGFVALPPAMLGIARQFINDTVRIEDYKALQEVAIEVRYDAKLSGL